jgi:hypothetical protein
MKIIDNFLEKEDFLKLKKDFESPFFPWYYNDYVNGIEDPMDYYQFVHIFYNEGVVNSDFVKIINPILNKLESNLFMLLRIKANLLLKTNEHIEHGFHTDYDKNKNVKITTGIFYINTNNGYTLFENGKKIESVENRYVEFDYQKLHSGSTCTDKKTRLVINFNYIKK